jgi:hypothetical protein
MRLLGQLSPNPKLSSCLRSTGASLDEIDIVWDRACVYVCVCATTRKQARISHSLKKSRESTERPIPGHGPRSLHLSEGACLPPTARRKKTHTGGNAGARRARCDPRARGQETAGRQHR